MKLSHSLTGVAFLLLSVLTRYLGMVIISPNEVQFSELIAMRIVKNDGELFNVKATIQDEETNTIVTIINVPTVGTSGSFTLVMFDSTDLFTEGKFYNLKMFDETGSEPCVYSGKIFCTEQTDLENYKMENDYLAPADSSNEYKTV